MPKLKIEAIFPPKGLFNVKGFLGGVSKLLRSTAKKIKKSFEITVRGMKEPIRFTVRYLGNDRLEVRTDNEIYYYLSLGTSKRWAIMSRNWRSKTRPNSLKISAGRGRVVIAGKRAMLKRRLKARKGIQARNFHLLIANQEEESFFLELIRLTDRYII
jgi:hypothetical protein